MGQTPKNPNVERVRDIPFEKDAVMPLPQVATRLHAEPRRAHEAAAAPASGATPPEGREEYPGPQTSPSGDHIEPGDTQPTR
jgi:hypothetical protein